MCLEQVRDLWSKLITKEKSTSRNPQDFPVSTKSRRSKKGELKSADSHSVSFLKDAFYQLNISPTVAFEFFKNKSKGLATNEVVFSTYRADELVAGNGIRSYTANSSTNQILSAGFCTCIVHAIRLLCLFKTVSSSSRDQKLRNVLRIMVKDIKTDPWKVDEVMLALNLELSTVTFQSLALSFVNLIGQSAYFGELSLATVSSTNMFEKKVKDLYHANTAAKESIMLFISLTGNKSSKEIDLPYVFLVETAKSYKEHVGETLIDLADDSDNDSKSITFQAVGMVYSLSEVDKPTSYTFQFITYSHIFNDTELLPSCIKYLFAKT
jgi:hypothetical protein